MGPSHKDLKDMPVLISGSEEGGVRVMGFEVWNFQGREGVKKAVRYRLPSVGAVSYL